MIFKYWRLCLSCFPVFLLILCVGMVLNYPSPAFPDINSGHYGFHLSTNIMSWLAGFSQLFALPGCIVSAWSMDRYGRKFAIVMTTLPLVIGWLLIVASFNVVTFAVGRVISGLTVGMLFSCAFVYISEITYRQMRGIFNMLAPLLIEVGYFMGNFLGAFLNWKWLAFLALTIVTAASLNIYFIYETPRWLVSKRHMETANEVIKLLWVIEDNEEIENEIKQMEANVMLVTSTNFCGKLKQLVIRPLWPPFVVTQLLMVFQQLTGVGYIGTYSVSIFRKVLNNSHSSSSSWTNPNYQASLVSASSLLGHLMSVIFIERFGRRVLLITSGITCTISLATFGACYYIQITDLELASRVLHWLPLTCLMVLAIGFAFGLGSVPLILFSELFPIQLRGVVNSIGMSVNFLCGFIVIKVFPLETVIPDYAIMWIYASVTLVSVVFVILFVPETKGRSLEEIQQQWYTSTDTLPLETID